MNTEPMDEWVDYAKRSGLLDENGVAPDPSKAQTAWFAFTYAWNRRSALTASEAPAAEQAPPFKECRHCGWECRPITAASKKWYPLEQAPAGEVPSVTAAAFDRLAALNESNAARIFELEGQNATLRAAIAALSTPPAVPPGHVIVPVEPTPEMIDAIPNCTVEAECVDAWRAMIAAAPSATQAERP